jgi:hypothetical protein
MSQYASSIGWDDSERKYPSAFGKHTLFWFLISMLLISEESSTPSEKNGALPPLST